MTTAQVNVAFDNASDATFRVWGKAISDMLTTLGLTKATNSNEIDWATVLKPAAGSWTTACEIRTVTDSTGTYYARILWGASTSGSHCNVAVAFGQAHDGAGNLVTTWGNTMVYLIYAAPTSATQKTMSGCFTSDGMVALNFGTDGMLSWERRRDDDGVPLDNDICTFGMTGYSSSTYASPLKPGISGATADYGATVAMRRYPLQYFVSSHFALFPWSATGSGGGGDVIIAPWHAFWPRMSRQMVGVSYIASEMAAGTVFSVTQFDGATRTYRATGCIGAANNGNTTYAAAMIWE